MIHAFKEFWLTFILIWFYQSLLSVCFDVCYILFPPLLIYFLLKKNLITKPRIYLSDNRNIANLLCLNKDSVKCNDDFILDFYSRLYRFPVLFPIDCGHKIYTNNSKIIKIFITFEFKFQRECQALKRDITFHRM